MISTKVTQAEQERKEILKKYRALLRSCRHKLHKSDKKLIRQAFELALEAHKDMRRKSGEPYIFHPVAVAQIVAEEIGLGTTSIVCALLHDVVEDTEYTLEDITDEFGNTVADITDGLTKISSVFDVTGSIQAENFRKILVTLAKDVRVILIKLADRLHNMRTMDVMPRHKQLKIASETIYLYAPLAHRFGLYEIKSELEDLTMKYTEPKTYKAIAKSLQETKRERTRYINEFIGPIKEVLRKQGFHFDIFGRPKSISSIWNKIKKKGISFDEVYDKFAIRIIIDSPLDDEKANCWKVYSMVTDFYTPNPDRLRDWISTSKINGYEALHCTVMGPKGRWVEVQIRTRRMNEVAERGYAAHWRYKDDSPSDDSALEQWLQKIRDLLENPDSNTFDFIDDFKLNLFYDEIYVFTPKGDLKVLPKNSTALDLAFEIHTDIGLKCLGAKVNHKIAPASQRLNNGDQVEILTSRKQQPNQQWLDQVVTAKARSKIKQALKNQRKKIAQEGKKILNNKFKQLKISFNSANLNQLLEYYQVKTNADLYYNISTGNLDVNDLDKFKKTGDKLNIATTGKPETHDSAIEQEIKKTLLKNSNLLVFGENSNSIDYNLAPCCQPIPGDDAFGFINKVNELEVHKANCPKAIKIISKYGNKIVRTKWTKEHKIAFLTGLRITGLDDVGIMHNITNVIYGELKINIQSITIESKEGVFEGSIILYVDDTAHLEELIKRLKAVNGIKSINRLEEGQMNKLLR